MISITPAQLADQLKDARLFKGVAQKDLMALLAAMKPQSFAAAAVIFEKDIPGDTMYVILSGNVRIYTRDSGGNEITLTNYGPGRIFGDFALIDEGPRSAAASTIDAVDVLALNRAEFLAFLPDYPMIGLAMLRSLTDRVRYITVYLNKVNDFGQRLIAGEYERALQEIIVVSTDDDDINGLISVFVRMVHSLEARDAAARSENQAESQTAR